MYSWAKIYRNGNLSNVYDLRRLRFQNIAGVDADFSRLIEGYDLLVIIPELTPADMIE